MILKRSLVLSAAGLIAMVMLAQKGSSLFGQAGEFPGRLALETSVFDTQKGTGYWYIADRLSHGGGYDETPRVIFVIQVDFRDTDKPSDVELTLHTEDSDMLRFFEGGLCSDPGGQNCDNRCTEEMIQNPLHKVTCGSRFSPSIIGGRFVDRQFFRVVYDVVQSDDPEDDGCHDSRPGRNPQLWREPQVGINASTPTGVWANVQERWHPYACLRFTNSGGGGGEGEDHEAAPPEDTPCPPVPSADAYSPEFPIAPMPPEEIPANTQEPMQKPAYCNFLKFLKGTAGC